MHQGLLFQAFFQGLDELVPPRLNIVFHVEDLLTLARMRVWTVLCSPGFKMEYSATYRR
jgi:hypothetical protein